ncbi:hypothetical protein [Kiloniella sp.]|uniref:hypothetical protein n=1 Tax=Kiloniella sp. TaxID=1938587 RepID=UPI003B01B4FE
MNIDVTQLSEDQLEALSQIDPEVASNERTRRMAYETLGDGFTQLKQASLQLEAETASLRKTKAGKALQDSAILDIVKRLLVTAEINDIEIGDVQFPLTPAIEEPDEPSEPSEENTIAA